MDWLPFTALSALGIGIWHEINRFPATDKTFRKLMERVDNLESENYDLKERGPLTVRQALQGSLNIPAVKMMYLIGEISVIGNHHCALDHNYSILHNIGIILKLILHILYFMIKFTVTTLRIYVIYKTATVQSLKSI